MKLANVKSIDVAVIRFLYQLALVQLVQCHKISVAVVLARCGVDIEIVELNLQNISIFGCQIPLVNQVVAMSAVQKVRVRISGRVNENTLGRTNGAVRGGAGGVAELVAVDVAASTF